MKRALCRFGKHNYVSRGDSRYECTRCGKKMLVIKAIWYSDLQELMESGKLSFKGFSAAVKRGYLQKGDFDLEDDL